MCDGRGLYGDQDVSIWGWMEMELEMGMWKMGDEDVWVPCDGLK